MSDALTSPDSAPPILVQFGAVARVLRDARLAACACRMRIAGTGPLEPYRETQGVRAASFSVVGDGVEQPVKYGPYSSTLGAADLG